MPSALSVLAMASIDTITLEVDDLAGATAFYENAFALGDRLQLRAAGQPTTGFRAFTLSLLVAQPADVDAVTASALAAGATALKPVSKSMWGYGGVVQAPDGTIWKVATSTKKNTRPATQEVEHVVLLIGAEDIGASKRFYADRGFGVGKSVPRTYVEFEAGREGAIKLGLYKRRALAKDAGVAPEGSGSHRIAIASEAGPFRDPDGFVWEAAPARTAGRTAAATVA